MTPYNIPLSCSAVEIESLANVLEQYKEKPNEKLIEAFEHNLSEVIGSDYTVAVNSGTSAIHLALKILGVSAGDSVPVSTFTYIGSINPIHYQLANPIFIDSEEQTWNMDPTLLETCLHDLDQQGKRPKAIIVVHSYGMPAKMNEINAICDRYQVGVIEDAAEAIGATYLGKAAGTLGDIGILSFNNNKTLTTFGGGALLTNSWKTYKKLKQVASHARESKPYYEHHELGYNYRMSPLNAAYGLSQLPELDKKIQSRRIIYDQYKARLTPLGHTLINEPDGFFSSCWLSGVLLKKGLQPLTVLNQMAEKGIETRPFWNPMHAQPMHAAFLSYQNGIADNLFARGLCLPSSKLPTESDLGCMIEILSQ